MINLNVLSGKKGNDAFIPKDINEYDFWRMYLSIININQPKQTALTRKQIDVLAHGLSFPVNTNLFVGDSGLAIQRDLKIPPSNVTVHKRNIIKKGYVVLEDNGLICKPSPALYNFQRYVKKAYNLGTLPNINFMMCFSIDNEINPSYDPPKVEQND